MRKSARLSSNLTGRDLERPEIEELVKELLACLVKNIGGKVKRFACGKCDSNFTSRWHLKRHIKVHQPRKDKLKCSKSWCDASFSTIFELGMHSKRCFLTCELCGREVTRSGREDGHMKVCSRRNS